jgi:hypothetical protein
VVACDVAGSRAQRPHARVGAVELEHVGALDELDPEPAQLVGEPVDHRVCLDVPLRLEVEARLDTLRASSGRLVAQTIPSFQRSKVTPSATIPSTSAKHRLPSAASADVPRS